MSRYYRGTNTVSLTLTQDWPLTLESADANGHAVVKVPFLDANLFTKPSKILVLYVPGPVADDATADAILATPGVATGEADFPASFGVANLDQQVPVTVTPPLPHGAVTAVVLGRVD